MASKSSSPPLKPSPIPPVASDRSIVTVRCPVHPTATQAPCTVRTRTLVCAIRFTPSQTISHATELCSHHFLSNSAGEQYSKAECRRRGLFSGTNN
jgi:hypothetical protein